MENPLFKWKALNVFVNLQVKLMKQVKEEADKIKASELRRNKEVAQLKKEQVKKESLIRNLEKEKKQKEVVLKRKQEEVSRTRLSGVRWDLTWVVVSFCELFTITFIIGASFFSFVIY